MTIHWGRCVFHISFIAKGEDGVSFIFFEHGVDKEGEDYELFFREDGLKIFKEVIYKLEICFKDTHIIPPLS